MFAQFVTDSIIIYFLFVQYLRYLILSLAICFDYFLKQTPSNASAVWQWYQQTTRRGHHHLKTLLEVFFLEVDKMNRTFYRNI